MTLAPTASETAVVIAAHTLDRWDSLCAAVDSVMGQVPSPREVVVAVDQNEALADAVALRYPGSTVVLNSGRRGAATTRNRGVDATEATFVAFLDDDAVACAGWLEALVGPLADPAVVGVGGHVAPLWAGGEPVWFPPEFYWAVGATYRGMPEIRGPVRNVWSENMAVRRAQFLAVNGFREGYGKTGSVSAPEDTDLCVRLAAAFPGTTWVYEPAARVGHLVPSDRATLRFLLRRSVNEGVAKAALGRMLGDEGNPAAGLADEKRHAMMTVPRGIASELRAAVRDRDIDSARRAGASTLALGAAATGLMMGTVVDATAGAVGSRASRDSGGNRGLRDVADKQSGKSEETGSARPGSPTSGLAARRLLTTTGAPWECLDVDVADRVPALPENPGEPVPGGAHILVRVHGEPVGTVWVATGGARLDAAELSALINAEHGDAVQQRLVSSRWRQEQDAARLKGGDLTVVVCTRNRPDGLRTTLDALQAQTYARLRVVVVDNAPTDDRTRQVVEEYSAASIPVICVTEPVPGLSRARNTGLAECVTELIAFLDDDETPATDWAVEIVRGFAAAPSVDCVTGLIVPRSLESHPEQLFELWGGHAKGLDLRQEIHDGTTLERERILFPLPPFGAGGNMAFRAAVLREHGGFNVALGAGTPVKGAEDTDMFARVLLDGGTLVYRPSATVGHLHRATLDALEDQIYGYGSGLTAWYVAVLRSRPALVLDLLGLVPRGIREVFSSSGNRAASHGDAFPASLRAASFRGLVAGPWNLVRSELGNRRVAA